MRDELVVLVTAPGLDDARRLASALVTEHLAACVNVVPAIESVYTWEGTTEVSNEALLIIKTVESRYQELEARVKALHQYTTPEIVAIKIERGLEPYLDWMREATSPV